MPKVTIHAGCIVRSGVPGLKSGILKAGQTWEATDEAVAVLIASTVDFSIPGKSTPARPYEPPKKPAGRRTEVADPGPHGSD